MSLSVGIVGLPNVGKSTLFNAMLKQQQALVANYPFATIDPNVGVVPVPDKRLDRLAEVVAASRVHPETAGAGKEQLVTMTLPPIVPATIHFIDIAGLVKGASEGEGLGNKFLAHIRETSIICLVIRAFSEPEVTLTGSGDPKTDLETILTELVLADLATLNKQTEPKGMPTNDQKLRWETIKKLGVALDQGKWASQVTSSEEEKKAVTDLCLMTMKPRLYAVNVDEAELSVMTDDALTVQYSHILQVPAEAIVVVSAKIEAELASLRPMEQSQYLAAMGMTKSGLERLISRAYQTLGLISFLTAGEKEVRAWTIRQGETALSASAVIHTDFAKHFIKADVISFEEFIQAGGWKNARERGLVRSEGRDYIVKNGEVIEFKIGT